MAGEFQGDGRCVSGGVGGWWGVCEVEQEFVQWPEGGEVEALEGASDAWPQAVFLLHLFEQSLEHRVAELLHLIHEKCQHH